MNSSMTNENFTIMHDLVYIVIPDFGTLLYRKHLETQVSCNYHRLSENH